MLRWSDTYKKKIRGDDCCPFWRPTGTGICMGHPHKKRCVCRANADGTGCPVFPDKK